MELNEAEISLLWDLLDGRMDAMHHYPRDYTNDDHIVVSTLRTKARSEALRLKLWWAR